MEPAILFRGTLPDPCQTDGNKASRQQCFWTMIRLLLIVLLVLLLIGSVPVWPYSSGWGYYPSSGLGLLLIILVLLAVARR